MTDSASRLREARKAAGFATAQDACDRFHWTYSSYSGHENGNRGLRLGPAKQYARAFRVDLGWLLGGEGPMQPDPNAGGFREAGIEAWAGKSDLVTAATRGLRSPQTYRATQDEPGFAIARGDLLVVEAQHQARAGDLVIANHVDTTLGTAVQILRRYLPPYFVGGAGLVGSPPTTEDANIVGAVVAVIRLADPPEG